MKQTIILLLVISVSLGLVYTEDQVLTKDQVETTKVEQGVQSFFSGPDVTNGCSCEGDDCGCCAHIKFDKLHIDDDACVNVTYLPDKYAVSLAFIWNDKVVFNKTISASNPPPICIGVPHVKLLEVCVRLYNISYDKEHFGGCIALEFELLGIKEDIPLGCIYKNRAKIEQDYKKFKQNMDEAKRNLNDIKDKTRETIKEWDYLVSDDYYKNLKKQVVKEIGSFRNYLNDALLQFAEIMAPNEKKEKGKE